MDEFLQMKKDIGKLKILEKKFQKLTSEIENKNKEVSTLLNQYEKEKKDVLHMQQESLTVFIQRITGRYDKKMEKELQEEIQAKFKYDAAKAELKEMQFENRELMKEILELKKLSNDFDLKVKKRRDELLNKSDEEGDLFRKLENEVSYYAEKLTEISNALTSIRRLLDTARSAINSLQKAESWATFDVWTKGGIITHAAKYSYIDDAQSKFDVLSSQLKTLKNDLSDFDDLLYGNLSGISSSQRAIDFWFDNIFTNLSVRSQIRDNSDTLRNLMGKLTKIENTLLEKQKEYEKQISSKESEQEKML